jgi:endonuclease-3 related protein
MTPFELYEKLLEHFGPQNWWPMLNGFEPPEWEVCVGAILTQNTNWKNVEKALENLKKESITSPYDIEKVKKSNLEQIIRPSGFYKQKAERLKVFADFVLGFGSFEKFSKSVTREQLLNVKGLGPETADSILLYALNRPVFVIDAYTNRICKSVGMGPSKTENYEELRHFFEKKLPKNIKIYKEFHALIVEMGKNHCKAKPLCRQCMLKCGYQQ